MNTRSIRRRFLFSALATAVAPRLSAQVSTENIRILCGYPPGGSLDIVSRRLAERLGRSLGRPAIVENKPGAAGRLAVESLKTAAADGSTLLVTPASVLTMYPHIYRSLSYDVFSDLVPVAMLASTGFCLAVGPAVPASVQSFAELSAWCKANPAQASCGNAGAGSFPHFMALLLARETGIVLNHVPYRGGSAAMLALTGGQVAMALATEGSAIALEKAGKLRVLATTGEQRSVFYPRAAAFAELGHRGLAQREWFAAFAPANTPAPIITRLAAEASGLLAEPDVRETWMRLGLAVTGSTPQELRNALRVEHDFWGPFIRASGFTPEA